MKGEQEGKRRKLAVERTENKTMTKGRMKS